MINSKGRIKIVCLACPGVHASALFGCFDVLKTAMKFGIESADANAQKSLDVKIVAVSNETIIGWNEAKIAPEVTIEKAGVVDAIVIPAIGDANNVPEQQPPELLNWLRLNFNNGATIAGICSGGCILAQAGLLDGEKATTHWAWATEFQRLYPKVSVHARSSMVFSGPGHQLVTSGGGALWNDVALFLINRFLGHEAAIQSAKYYLIDWGKKDQLAYCKLAATRQYFDARIRCAQEAILSSLQSKDALKNARAAANLPTRTFERRFKAATGSSPVKYIQLSRIEKAKLILERQSLPIDDIANECGYNDTSTFRRLFIRLVGISPSEYRRRFGSRWEGIENVVKQ
ncbi:GlxA family transcriptional regulator [Pseudovibrio sp. Alg231-02]|uniref:GlxA family transcriptional regulator n=1 Tax=Pseudovibrio sp. Alg231-02 TaxID=1922223 RepID=UPI000D54C883|nr:helix-turn-helix domain-containing protein [Pseudovibrio sp. Alg231-02]